MHTLKYVTHKGIEINLLQNGIRTRNLDNLFQSFYEVVEKNGRISHFKTKVHTMTIQVDFLNWKGISWKERYDALVDAIDSDVRSKSYGTLYFDDYQLKCYLHASKPSAINFKSIYMQCELSIITDQKAWFREEKSSFTLSSEATGNTKRYAYRYPYRYQAQRGVQNFYNDFSHDARFKLYVYGPALNPSVKIGDVNYQVLGTPVDIVLGGVKFAHDSAVADQVIVGEERIKEARKHAETFVEALNKVLNNNTGKLVPEGIRTYCIMNDVKLENVSENEFTVSYWNKFTNGNRVEQKYRNIYDGLIEYLQNK